MSTGYGPPRTSIQTRFWNPHGTELQLTPEGLLWNPLEEFLAHFNKEVRQLEELRDEVCLVLLGEPGAGKSTSLHAEYEAVRSGENSEAVLYFDLSEYTSDESIRRYVFGGSEWQRWRDGDILTLFLDSYDECRLSLRTVANILIREFRNLNHRERLKLRITCRGGVWPSHFEQQLDELWPTPLAI